MQNKKGLALSQAKGFTIIELIVVIAIIAILAAIVMVNVTQYIAKSKLAANMATLKQLSILGTSYMEEKSTYAGFCNSPEVQTVNTGLTNNGASLWCRVQGEYWVAFVKDSGGSCLFCIDANGVMAEQPCYASSPLRCKI